MLKDRLNKIIGGGVAKRFILWTVAIIVFLDILAANFMLTDLNKTLSDNLNGTGNFLVKHLAQESGGSLLGEDKGNLNQLAFNIKNADSDVKYVYITDAWNNIIADTFPGDFVPPAGENIIDFKAQIPGSGGFAHVGMDRTSINERINNETHIVIFNILTAAGLGILMAYVAGIYLTRPIRNLVKGAQEVGKGNLGYEIETGSTDDDFKTLSNAFNQMSHNLKEKEKLEMQLIQSNKLATVGQLAAGIAHEINNPLGNISLYTQMLLKRAKNQDAQEKLTVINDEANRAAEIVKGLLDFARQSEPRLSNIDINNEIVKVLSILKPNLKDIRVNTDTAPLPLILADGGQIQQVIMNLLKNSIQSITENGEITVKTIARDNNVEIHISDNGCGIPKENLDRIFDPFFTTKEPGEGTGLGLSISYGIIKRHNGSIEVKSEVGKGTTFAIKLPV